MTATYEFLLEMTCTALQAEVRANDCTIFRTFQPSKRVTRLKLTPWCLVGENRLDIELAPMEHDERIEPAFMLDLFKVPWGTEPGTYAQLLGFTYTDNEVELPELGEPPRRVYHHRFRINERYGDWCWLGATPYQPEDRGDVVAALTRLHQALQDSDTGTLLATLGIRRSEICEALRLDPEEVELDEHAFFESYFEEPDWAMEPLLVDELEVIPEAGGRLVRVTRPDGIIPLLGKGGQRPFVFDVTFSNLDGSWLPVR